MADKVFYITTPIYYPSDKLHIGHALTTTMADSLARYKKMQGYDVFFLTGSDEHGQKIERRAKEAGLAPLAFVDRIVESFKNLWKVLDIEYSDFIRTSEKRHQKVVQALFKKIYDQGDIYKSEYEGWYCTPCETFWTERQLSDGMCPDCGRPVELLKEESYFFRMSKYADRLVEYIETHPDFIQPVTRKNEMLAFIKQGLEDLCISRTTFNWGIPVPIDEKHVIYVWFDALTNYISALGYGTEDASLFEKYWPHAVHLVGKDIMRFHTIIWPIILMAAGIELPKKVFGHGWLLVDGSKMSKSKGNVVDPLVLVDQYGTDAIRYFLLREMPYGSDGYYSDEALILRINTDLANDYGNLLSRTTSMLNKFCQGIIPEPGQAEPLDEELKVIARGLPKQVDDALNNFEFSAALSQIWKLINKANKYIEETAPWALAKDPAKIKRLHTVMYNLVEAIRISTVYISPFMPNTPAKVWAQLGLSDHPEAHTWESILNWGGTPTGIKINRGEPIFPRIEESKEVAIEATPKQEETKKVEEIKQAEQVQANEELANVITIDDFAKVELRVAEVVEAKKVEKADKLLELKVRIGEEERTIVAGIALHYTPEELVGKKIVIVYNLKPAKLRGITSQGMLLAASEGDKLGVLTVDKDIPSGAKVK